MISDGARWAAVPAALATHISEAQLQTALELARAIPSRSCRAALLVELIPHLPESQRRTVLQQALEAAPTIPDEYKQAEAVADEANRLDEMGYGRYGWE